MKYSLLTIILLAITLFTAAETIVFGAFSAPQFTKPNGSMTHGFKLQWTKQVDELKITARMFLHEKSGAPLLYFSNGDENKVFCISFRTPPNNSTGVAHIMEHSALCGSEKYPSKEPFVDLLKSSLQTFLNAFTADDRTMYPVASTNDKDFSNLMGVYLDAVFFPNVKKIPEILMQEGWHYEIDEESGELTYNGIVYNEMKGVYSSPQSVLYRTIQKVLYADSTYANDSGGNPDDIPALTQEQFVKFHDKFYHPSNSLIYLYGNGDIEKHLQFLDKEYLSRFEKKTIDASVKEQPLFDAPKDVTAEYSVGEKESTKEKTFLSVNYLLPKGLSETERNYGMDFLTYLLVDSEAGPLKRALLDAGIGKDVDASFDSSILQPCFSIIVQNSDPEKKDKFLKVLDKTLRDLVKNGIDRKLIEGAINRNEFALREFQLSGFPKGLALDMWVTESWIYGADPLQNLHFDSLFKKIRSEVPNNFFEELVQKFLIDNKSRAFVMLMPKAGLEKEHAEKLAAKLAEIKKSLSSAQLEQIKEGTKKLKERQSSPDSPEDVAKIPTLSLSDIDPKEERIPFQKDSLSSMPVVNIDVDTNGIAYFAVRFQLEPWKHKPEILSFLSEVLGRLDTEHYTFSELSTEIDLHTGGVGTGLSTSNLVKKPGEFVLSIGATTKTTLPKLEKGLELINEILQHTRFDDKARLKEIVQEQYVGMQQSMMSSGHTWARSRATSYFSAAKQYGEHTDGIEYYKFLTDLETNWDKKADEFAATLKQYAAELFNKNNGRISVTIPKEDFAALKPVIENFEKKFNAAATAADDQPAVAAPKLEQLNEAVVIPSKVQYVVKAGDYRKAGFEYSGKMLVLTNILRTGYLWNNIRVLGGAYGSGVSMERSGVFTFWSYRDPNLKNTVDIFEGVADYLEKLELTKEELSNAVISTIGGLDKPLTAAEKGGQVAGMQTSGLTQEDLQRQRDEVLSTTVEDLRKYAKLFREGLKQGNICVFGNEQKIEADKTLFKNTIRPIE